MEPTEKTPLKNENKAKLLLFIQSFSELFQSSRNLFYLLGIGFIETLGILSVLTGLSIYLSSVKNLSDLHTGLIIASYGLSQFIYSLFLGSLIDVHGIKKSLVLGNCSALLGLILLSLIKNTYLQVSFLLTFISLGASVVLPCLKLGIKEYTNDKARSLGYSMLLIILFGGGALAGILIDIMLTVGGRNEATFTLIFYSGTALMSTSTLLSLFIAEIQGKKPDQTSWTITKEVLRDIVFWKFMVLTLLLVVVKSMFNHITITLPLYMNREIEDGAHFGIMLAIHKVTMVVFIPLLTGLVYFFNPYTLLMIGGFISALSVVPLLVESSYLSVIVFVVVVSLAESLYAPRLIDYTLSIAPTGKEGTFLAIASSPMSMGTIIAGLLGGSLLENLCPSHGPSNCSLMWGIIGLIALLMPILMLVFRVFLEVHPKELIKLV